MKSALSRQLNRRRDMALRRLAVVPKQKKLVTVEESISKGRREIIIEPSCSVVHDE